MKTVIKTLVLALTLSSVSYVASANPATGDKKTASPTSYKAAMFPSANKTTLNVLVEKEMGNRVEIRVKDAYGAVLHTEHLTKKEGKFWSKLNLSELANGTYRVEVTNGTETTAKDITISTVAPAAASRTIALN